MENKESYRKHRVMRHDGPELNKMIHPHFLNYHKMSVESDYEYPKHKHSTYEAIWIEQGPYFCLLNNEELTIDSGGLLIIKPGDTHQDHLKKGQSHYVVHFSMDQPLFAASGRAVMQVGNTIDKSVLEIFREIEKESSRTNPIERFAASLQDALFEILFWRFIRSLPESALSETFSRNSRQQEFSTELYRVFHQYQNKPLSVESMAEKMRLSTRNLSLKCGKYFGDSPGKLFLRYKIQIAEVLLTQNDKNIKEISFELGFDTPFNFSRAFKRVTGRSPSEFRNTHERAASGNKRSPESTVFYF